MSLEPGQKLGRYRIVRLIAQGGMAEVYRADQELAADIFRPAALKVIRTEYSESPDFREMFLDEARVACTLSHPNIVHIYEVGEAEGRLFMAMELVHGETLAAVARLLREKNERLTNEALFAVGIATCSALAAVHALKAEGGHVKLVHRDVSPHNLLLAQDGTLKLIDFGIAKAATNRNLTNPGVTKGKAGYFSPEQAMGKPLDGRSDLFSLGVTLYKLASGQTPFDKHRGHHERNSALVRGQWEPLESVVPNLPRGFYEVVSRAMQLKPEARYADAREMREALEKAAFAAGIPLRQDALYGYVSADGEVSAVPQLPTRVEEEPRADGPTVPLEPLRPEPPRLPPGAPRRRTERVVPGTGAPQTTPTAARNKRNSALKLGAAFGVAVLVGVGVTLVAVSLAGESPAEKPSRPAPPLAVLEPPPTASPEGEVVAATDPVVRVDTPTPTPTPRPRPVKVRPVVVALPPPAAKPEEEPAPPPIPAGEGSLRINTTRPDVATQVLVDGKDWGQPPAVNKVPSGRYAVELKLKTGRRSAAWRGPVYPGAPTILFYDADENRWQKR